MNLFAQQGYGTGSGDNDRIIAGLRQGYIDGAIISPKDYSLERTVSELTRIRDEFPHAARLFDPQWYASILANDPDSRLGNLLSGDYSYFHARRRSQLESEGQVRADLEACLSFQINLPVTSIIAPSIVIRQRFNSVEAVIAKTYLRNAAEVWNSIGDARPLLGTLAIDSEALQDRHALEEFLAEITILDTPPSGIYLLVHQPTSEIPSELIDPRTLAGWMLTNYSLNLNGFEVVNGYSDLLTPFLGAAGAAAGATGWFNTQKVFSLDRFAPPLPGGRRPVPRYLSTRLINSIRVDELQLLRGRFTEIVNGLATDLYYDPQNGSMPDSQVQEVLQTWEALRSLDTTHEENALGACVSNVKAASALYERINISPGLRLSGRSNGDHLDSLNYSLHMFAELAELNF